MVEVQDLGSFEIITALAALEQNDYETARLSLTEALLSHPSDGNIHHLLGIAHTGLGAFDLAVESFRSALEIDPDAQESAAYLEQIESYRDYQRGVLERRNSVYLNYPPQVHIETFTQCNADCSFCPYSSLDRLGVKMSDALITKIIDDLTDIPASVSFSIAPQKVNEPFLDNRIFDVFDEIHRKLPNAQLSINSNGAALTDTIIAKLAKVKNTGRLWISLNDHRPDVYQQLMSMPLDRTLDELDRLHAQKAAGAIPFPIQIGRVRDYTDTDAAFFSWVEARYPAFEPGLVSRGDWAGQVDEATTVPMAIGCQRWFDLSITSTGKVALCCMDGQAAHVIGDVNTTHALEVYNAPAYRSLRENTLDRTQAAAPCNTCSFL